MPSTLLDLISSAMTAIGQLGQGQTANAEDGAQGLRQANLFLQRSSTRRLLLPYVATRDYALVASVVDYSLGPSAVGPGAIVASRPNFIESAQIEVVSGYWVPISVWDKEKWDAIRNKGAVGAVPDGVYVEYLFPNIGLHFNPATTGTPAFRLGTWEALQQFAGLFDQINMPPEYEEYLESNLAIILAPFYDQPIPPGLLDRASKAEVSVMEKNAQGLGGSLTDAQRFASPNLGRPVIGGAPPPGPPVAPSA